jgi:hypothetical protein
MALNELLRPSLPAPAAVPATAEPGATLDVLAGLSLSLGKVADQLAKQANRQEQFIQALHLIEVPVPQITAASGTVDQPELLGPKTGKVWDVKRITAATFTAGTVSLYSGGVQTDQQLMYVFSQSGTLWFGSNQLMLQAGQRLMFAASSTLVGNVTLKIAAVELDAALLPDYLL